MAKSPATANGNGNGSQVQEKERAAKTQKASATYINSASGEEWNFPNILADTVRTTFSNGVERDYNVDKASEGMKHCALLLGFARRLQTSYQNEKEVDRCIEAVDETIADLANDVWIAPKDGPRVMVVANALRKVLEGSGETVSSDRFASIVQKLKTDEFMEKAMKNKAVVVAIEEIKTENAKARLAAAKAAAKGDTASASLDF